MKRELLSYCIFVVSTVFFCIYKCPRFYKRVAKIAAHCLKKKILKERDQTTLVVHAERAVAVTAEQGIVYVVDDTREQVKRVFNGMPIFPIHLASVLTHASTCADCNKAHTAIEACSSRHTDTDTDSDAHTHTHTHTHTMEQTQPKLHH